MKKLFLSIVAAIGISIVSNAQCTLTNATSCKCSDSTITDCDLRPDIQIARLPLTQAGNYSEYPQVCNPPCSGNDGRLRLGVATPIIGLGPLETRGTSKYVCGIDTIDAGTVGNIPATCPTSGLPPHQLINQRIYHKSGSTMTWIERAAGSMTFHPSHGHQHVDNWGVYTLRTQTADPNPLNWPIIGSGTKLGFCLLDITSCQSSVGSCTDAAGNTLTSTNFDTPQYRNYGLGGGSYGCSNNMQGISNGFMDIYSQGLDGMWIVVPPGTCNGTYYVVVEIDPLNYFEETNENNNVVAVPFTLTQQAGTAVTVGASGPTTFCQGGSITLTASGGALNYLWSNGATTQSIVVNASGTFSVITNTATTCPSTSAPVTVNVTPMTVSASSSPLNVCMGQSIQLNTTTNASSTVNVIASTTSNTQVFIPDNIAAGVTSTINLSGINPATLSANSVVSVTLNLTHTYDGDLIVSLISPSGNTIYLSNRRGGGGDNFTNTIFTMSATTAIGSVTAPFTGSFIPDGAFSALTGNVNGSWQLKVADVAAVDTGRIQNWTLKVYNAIPNVVTYNWNSAPAGFTSGQQNPTTTPAATTAYTVSVNDLSGCAGSSTVNVTVNPIPVVSVTPASTICAGTNKTLTASGASSYLWSNGATTASITVSPSVNTTYSVTGTTASCSGSNSTAVNVNPAPLVTSSSTAIGCFGGTNGTASAVASGGTPGYDYSWNTLPVQNTSTATGLSSGSYTVTVTDANGCTATNSQSVSTPIVLTSSANVTNTTCGFSNGAIDMTPSGGTAPYSYSWTPGGASSQNLSGIAGGSYSVLITDANGCIHSNTFSVGTSGTAPSSPASVSGNDFICKGAFGISYSVAPVAGATSYVWSVPSGATIGSGQGTTNLSINFSATQASGTVCVYASNICGNSAPVCKTLTVVTAKPGMPASISGQSTSCAGTNGVVYSCPAVANTQSYNWFIPTGASIVSGANTNTITVNFDNTFLRGYIKISASNCFGTSSLRSFYVNGKPTTPGTMTGAINGICAGSVNIPYSIVAVSAATGYTWTAPANASIVSGQGTTSVLVNFSGSFTSGALKVTANNVCGSSGARSTTIRSVPVAPGALNGPVTVCANQTGVAYSIAAVAGATSYQWTAPNGAIIASGQGTTSVTVNFGPSSGTLTVRALNACGQSSGRNVGITINCRTSSDPISELSLFPNPAHEKLSISFYSASDGQYKISVADVTGRIVYVSTRTALQGKNQTELNLIDFAKGIYLLSFEMNEEQLVKKVVID